MKHEGNIIMESKHKTDVTILTPSDIMKMYGLSRPATKAILDKRGCPLLTGGRDSKGRNTGRHYRIEQSAFEEFLKGKSG